MRKLILSAASALVIGAGGCQRSLAPPSHDDLIASEPLTKAWVAKCEAHALDAMDPAEKQSACMIVTNAAYYHDVMQANKANAATLGHNILRK